MINIHKQAKSPASRKLKSRPVIKTYRAKSIKIETVNPHASKILVG
jgi:hypothetical protein